MIKGVDTSQTIVSGSQCQHCQDPLAAHTDTQAWRISLQLDTLLVPPENKFKRARALPGVCNVQSNIRSRYPCSLWRSHASLVHVPLLHGAVLNIRSRTLNFQISSPRASPNVLSDALMHPSRCGFTGENINATFMKKHIECKLRDCWTMQVRISIYIMSVHTDLH